MTPYSQPLAPNVKLYDIKKFAPVGYDHSEQLSANFQLWEFVQATFVTDEQRKDMNYIPINSNAVSIAQLLRDILGVPVKVTAHFRSVLWDKSQGRSGESAHTESLAIDLKGKGLFELVAEAVETKNDLYYQLKGLGVTGYGFYPHEDFVHFDFREAKSDGSDRLWGSKKKDESNSLIHLLWLIPLIFFCRKAIRRSKFLRRLLK